MHFVQFQSFAFKSNFRSIKSDSKIEFGWELAASPGVTPAVTAADTAGVTVLIIPATLPT